MAACEEVQWTVVVVVEEDKSLTGTYRLSANTRLSEILQLWKKDFELIGDWVFPSAIDKETYYDEWMTLEMIGESVPRMVCLKAELSYESVLRPTNEIFVNLRNKCHRLFVKPHDKLYEIAWRLPGKPRFFEYNGTALNLKDTVQQAGLYHNSVIHESLSSVAVTLSSGETVAIKMPSDSFVLQLKERVNLYETDDFSLTYQGRCLRPEESIAKLKRVKVTVAEFVVNVSGQSISWRTKDEPISVSEFVSKLAVQGNIETKKLEMLQFVCAGCQRRICLSKDSTQQLPVQCCKKRSLKLNAMAPSDFGTSMERNETTELIQRLQEQLMQCRLKDSDTAITRGVCRTLKQQFEEEGLDYNVIMGYSHSLMKRFNELQEKIKELQIAVETWKTKNVKSEEEIERLRAAAVRNREEIEKMKEENGKMLDELEEKLGAKLLIIYDPEVFWSPSSPEVQARGQVPWETFYSYIKFQVLGIRHGWTPVEEVVAVLQRLFSRGKIATIWHCLGSVAERIVTMTTSRDDELANVDQSPFCGVEGTQHSWEEAEKQDWLAIGEGGSVFVCGGGQRTVLWISKW